MTTKTTTSVAVEAPVRGWRFSLPRIVTSILVPVLLLGIAEAALRWFGVGRPI